MKKPTDAEIRKMTPAERSEGGWRIATAEERRRARLLNRLVSPTQPPLRQIRDTAAAAYAGGIDADTFLAVLFMHLRRMLTIRPEGRRAGRRRRSRLH